MNTYKIHLKEVAVVSQGINSFYDFFFLTHSFYLGHLPVLMKVAKAGGLVVEVFLKW